MADDLPKMETKTLIIWGRQDVVTPPNVGEDFNSLLPNSDLIWIDNFPLFPPLSIKFLKNEEGVVVMCRRL